MSSNQELIVVGVDGSPGAEAGLRWALKEAQARNAPVRLLTELLTTAVARAANFAPNVEVTEGAVDGSAAQVLVEASARATRVVLGSRRLKALGSALLGSVGAAVVARAGCDRGPRADGIE
jgi:nucleotide-binding universal stress UspA family protein